LAEPPPARRRRPGRLHTGSLLAPPHRANPL
jgi:hypothetical protein